jgi:hypothetical protein
MYFSLIVPVYEMIVKAVRRKYPIDVSDATKLSWSLLTVFHIIEDMPRAPFDPVFYPPLVGIPPPKTLTPSQAKHLYAHIRTVAFYLDAITALVPQTRDSPIQVSIFMVFQLVN